MMHWGSYGWGMGFGWIWMVLFWVLIIGGVAHAIRSTSWRGFCHHGNDLPLDTLKKRYAQGEITKDEFERTKDDLAKS